MDLSLTESQEMLRSATRTFIEREAPTHAIVAHQRAESSLAVTLLSLPRSMAGARAA